MLRVIGFLLRRFVWFNVHPAYSKARANRRSLCGLENQIIRSLKRHLPENQPSPAT